MQYNLKLSLESIQHIGNGLMELPAKTTMPIINDINRQMREQDEKNSKKKSKKSTSKKTTKKNKES